MVYGTMEYWNVENSFSSGVDSQKELFSFDVIELNVKNSFAIRPNFHFPRTHYSGIPVFHHSNCERSEQT